MEELEIKGIKYISSKRASKITGYAKDYIGQLARAEKVPATRVGRAWYVSEKDILIHAGKDTPEETEGSSTELLVIPEKGNTRSLHELQTGKANTATRLKTWSSVAYFEDDYSLLPEKIKFVEPKVSVHNIVPQNIASSAERRSVAPDVHLERRVHFNKKQTTPSFNPSMDGVSLASLKKDVVVNKADTQISKRPESRKKQTSSRGIPVVSTLALGGVTAGFLVLILSGNVVPVEWGTGGNTLSSASVSSAPMLDGFISYLKGLFDAGILLITMLFSTIFSMFWEFVSSGISFVLSLF